MLSIMERDALIAQIKEIPAGRFFRLKMITSIQPNAAAKEAAITIEKETMITSRTGCHYPNIAGVVLKEQSGGYQLKENEEWIVKDRVKYNRNTGKYYLVLYPINQGAHPQVTYVLREGKKPMRIVTKEELIPWTRPSYWKAREGGAPKMITVDLDNIELL